MTTRDEIAMLLEVVMDGCFQYHRTGAQAMAVDLLIDEARTGVSDDLAWKRIVFERDRLLSAIDAAIAQDARPDGDVSISDAMVEAGARALHNLKTAWGVRPWEETSEFYRTEYRCMARAALDAAHDRPGGEEA